MATTTIKNAPTEHANGSAEMIEAIEINVQDVQESAAKAGDTLLVWLHKLANWLAFIATSLGEIGLRGLRGVIRYRRLAPIRVLGTASAVSRYTQSAVRH